MSLFSREKKSSQFKGELIFIILLIFLCLFIFSLRSRNLDRLSLWMDEGFYVLAAQQIIHHGYPLYPSGHILFKGILYSYLLAFFGLIFGPETSTFRMISVISSVLVLPLFYLLARKLVNPALAFIGTLILAFSAWETEYSRTAIYFSVLQLVYLAGLYFFHLAYLERKRKYFWPTLLLFLLAPHIHQLAMGLFFSFLALFFIFGLRRFLEKEVTLPLFFIALSYLLLQLHELFFWKVGHVYEKEVTSFKEGLSYFFQSFTLSYFREILQSFPRMGVLVFLSFFLYLGLRTGRKLFEPGEKNFLDRWLFLIINFLLPLIFMGFFRTHIQPRYLFQLHPLLLLLFLVAVQETSKALINLILQPFSLRPKMWLQKSLVWLLALICFSLFSDQVSWTMTQKIINRDYKDRITTDVITRSGRTEHHDYQGVGSYVRQYLKSDDIVIAMHMVFQYVYGGGKVDYWLWTGGPGTWDAWEKTAEGWKDIYVGARWLNSLDDLKKVITQRGNCRLWLVATPSLYQRDHINQEVADYILSQKHRLVFRGRDALSAVYLWEETEEAAVKTRPLWEAEWLPASLGEIKFDSTASRGSFLRLARSQKIKSKNNIPWTNELPPGIYQLCLALRTQFEEKKLQPSRLEITLRTKKTNLVVFHGIVRSEELPATGEWLILRSRIQLPPAKEFNLSVSFQGERVIEWDYVDFVPLTLEDSSVESILNHKASFQLNLNRQFLKGEKGENWLLDKKQSQISY
ncbi:MAG: glycosyltransferase family 39 protein [Candidatus Aminicenantes bacterium]|nr:glycosyltransferase family 39 protein [Candidatus Aminicenantes bacterium]